MFRGWGSWLGAENGNVRVKKDDQCNHDVNKASADEDEPPQLLQTAKGFGGKSNYLRSSRAKMSSLRFAASITTRNTRLFFSGYMYNFASSVSKKVSESVAETAESLKKSVEEGDINGIIDKVGSSRWLISPQSLLSRSSAHLKAHFPPSDHPGAVPERTRKVCAGEQIQDVW